MPSKTAGPALPSEEASDRRKGEDRRSGPTPFISRYTFVGRGRRMRVRREEDRLRHRFVDRYGIYAVMPVLTALLLCVADAFFTVQLIESGAREVNPVMRYLLSLGPVPFLLAKYVATGGSLLFLLLHNDRSLWGGRVQGRHILAAVPLTYALIILWQISLNRHLI